MTTLTTYEFRDPAALMSELAERVPLVEGSAHLVLVELPSTTQRIVRVDRLRVPAEILDDTDARDEMRRVIDGWALPDTRPFRHASVLVLARPGLCVFGPNEAEWFRADRYLINFQPVHTGNCVLVTEHGWVDASTLRAGTEPALQPMS